MIQCDTFEYDTVSLDMIKKLSDMIHNMMWYFIQFILSNIVTYHDKISYDTTLHFIIFLLWYNISLYDTISYTIYIEPILIKINMAIKGHRLQNH